MVRLERGLDFCPTENRDGLAENAIPSTLDKIEPGKRVRLPRCLEQLDRLVVVLIDLILLQPSVVQHCSLY